jgi:hypothetical protein
MRPVLASHCTNSQAQEYLRKITTVATDIEAAWEAVFKMYQVTLEDREVAELVSILLWITRATRTLYLSEVVEWLQGTSACENPATAVTFWERIETRFGLLLKVFRKDGRSTIELAHPAMMEHIREYLAKYSLDPFPPPTRGAEIGANIDVPRSSALESMRENMLRALLTLDIPQTQPSSRKLADVLDNAPLDTAQTVETVLESYISSLGPELCKGKN